ncbi:reverse transcriptase domain-containing protein [Tanacetum coccineum]
MLQKSWSKEVASSFVNSLRMLKIPVEGGIITLKSSRGRLQQAVQSTLTQLGHFCLKACGYDWRPKAHYEAPPKRAGGMLSDFKDLNKACPKDGYSLPQIEWNVESLCGFPFKCFLDAYKGYHQIQMAKEDEEKKAFITSQGIFCYTKIPFGQRNAGATYQRLVDKAFHKQISRNLKVYVDDLVIKSRKEDEIVRDIEETFKTLREINMKLNPKKCTFRIEEGMFLGYKVSNRGLKILADFIVERPKEDSPDTLMTEEEELLEPWILFTDGSSSTDGSGAGLILINPEGMEFTYALRFRAKGKVYKCNGSIGSSRRRRRYVDESYLQIPHRWNTTSRGEKARAVRHKSWRFAIINGILYKNYFLGPWLRLEEGIKARLDERSKNWMEELSHVLWAHSTMIKTSNEDTPFSLTYGTEAVIPIDPNSRSIL